MDMLIPTNHGSSFFNSSRSDQTVDSCYGSIVSAQVQPFVYVMFMVPYTRPVENNSEKGKEKMEMSTEEIKGISSKEGSSHKGFVSKELEDSRPSSMSPSISNFHDLQESMHVHLGNPSQDMPPDVQLGGPSMAQPKPKANDFSITGTVKLGLVRKLP
ncbi:hypothetical protein ACH5RR_021817 [Cinchona calisaya]|uniref:Uncharacterized protein n=1 Tax=Cinchona calisaya TaxID=153742 RepID=A0ABD2ZNC6_9GENT